MTRRDGNSRRLRLAVLIGTLVSAVVAPTAIAQSDERGYEMVSPANKGGGSVLWGSGGFAQVAMDLATADGSKLMFNAYQPFPDSAHGQHSAHLAVRTSTGWQSKPASPAPATPTSALAERSLVYDATDDFSTWIYQTFDNLHPLDQDAFPVPGFYFNMYDVYTWTGSGQPSWLSRADADVPDTEFVPSDYVGRSEDASTVYFATPAARTPNATPLVAGYHLYSRSPQGTRLTNVDSEGQVLSECGASLGSYSRDWHSTVAGAVSPDGRRAFFQVPDREGKLVSGDPSCFAPPRLFMNDGGEVTEISASQMTTPEPPVVGATYQGASRDGSRVLFVSGDRLTDGATTGGGLYSYDVPTGNLEFLSTGAGPAGAQVRNVIKVSDDASRAYFLAKGKLLPDGGVEGGENIYMWDDGDLRFVAAVADADVDGLRHIEAAREARVTADGGHFLFLSFAELTARPTGGKRSAYLWDAANGTLTCVSCHPTGAVPSGDASLRSAASSYLAWPVQHDARNLAGDGSHVFFETKAGLAPGDVNGAVDVYEYREGELTLISDGRAKYGSLFFDASADGRDAFFATSASLVGQDVDNGDNDVYDARIGGGFAPPNPEAPCGGDACQRAPGPTPEASTPGSEGFGGSGNIRSPSGSLAIVNAARLRAVVGAALSMRIRVSGRGSVRVTGGAIRGSRRAFAKAGTARLRVVLKPKARKALRRRGSVRAKLRVAFRSSSGALATRTLSVKFTRSSALRAEGR